MPIVNLPLPEVDQLISRPVVYAVIEQIKKITNIPQDVSVTYIGQGGAKHQVSSTTGSGQGPVKLASDAMLTVEVDEQPDEGLFATTVGNRTEHMPDFYDKELGIEFKPIYCGFDFVVTVVYRTPSRSEAIRWRNDARYKASQMRMVNLHELEYQYQIPKPAIQLLTHLHALREAKSGYGESFAEYFTQHLTTRSIAASTITGTNQEVLIREKQFRVQGMFDFTFNPEKQEKNEGNGWEVRFTYTFSFHKPVEYSLRYPVLVHNQPIEIQYVPLEPQDPTEAIKRMSASINAIHAMEEPVMLKKLTGYEPIWRQPVFDSWTPDVTPPSQRIFASFLLGLEEGFQGKILNLNDLGDYFIDSDIINWIMKEEWKYIHLPHTSAIQIQLYRNECLSAPQAIEVNSAGDIILLEPAMGRKRYRITISLVNKLNLCDPRSLKRLARYPNAMCKVIKHTKSTTGELHSLLPQVDLGKFESCAIRAGVTRQQAIDGIVSIKTVMKMAVLASTIDHPTKLSPVNQLLSFQPLP